MLLCELIVKINEMLSSGKADSTTPVWLEVRDSGGEPWIGDLNLVVVDSRYLLLSDKKEDL